MERIKKALERARQERQIRGEANFVPVATTSSKLGTAASGSPVEVTYTQTRVVKADPEELKEKRIMASLESDAIADAYKVLRTQVLQRMRAEKWNSLIVTSPTEGNGKSLTAVNLAFSLAREVNHTVLLVDLDLRQPTIADYFFDEESSGISDYLKRDMPLDKILFNPGIERMVVLPGHESFSHSSEMLSSPKMVRLIEELKSRYPSRLVVVDMPPVLACDDVLAFSPHVDAVLLVVEEGKTHQEELKRTIQLLHETEICGIVVNKSCEANSAYGYSYGGYGY